MEDIKLSIIIPVFNSEKYLTQCIESAVDQTLSEIEIIIINDGSTDESRKIIQSFATKDKRILFIDAKNEGVSAARNKGIRIAKGEFIGFIDSDDWIEPRMYELLYGQAKETGSDLAICNMNIVTDNNEYERLTLSNKVLDIANERLPKLVDLMRFKYDYSACNKIYSNKIIQENKLNFDGSVRIYEDLFFNCCYFQYSQKAVVINKNFYYYRIHTLSTMHSRSLGISGEYSKLFQKFNTFCNSRGLINELDTFNTEMRRGFYFALIPKIYEQIKDTESSLLKRARLFADSLAAVDNELFAYQKNELNGIYGMKKRMLKDGRYYLFSLVTLIKNN